MKSTVEGKSVYCRVLPLLSLIAALLVTGCVSTPYVHSGTGDASVAGHVAFLAHPALRGRKPLTSGSRKARRYIHERFSKAGLVPWGDAEDYFQSVRIGTNVIGVLPGTDPNLADEYVLVSAHYDHLGKGYLGAADNAAGVAALLGILERLSEPGSRPKRPVCFAAFDCEERGLIGSFAFTCRDDFQPSQIAAVVNMDILGRQLLDVIDDTLFITGTESYPGLRRTIADSGRTHDLRMLPIGTDVVGPRSDHIAFEGMGFPVLFFSSGVYKDYHEKGDTADKLHYNELTSATEVVFETVQTLANANVVEEASPPTEGDRAELASAKTVLSEILASHESTELDATQVEGLESMLGRAEVFLGGGDYSLADRHTFWRTGIKALGPLLYPDFIDEEKEEDGEESEEAEALRKWNEERHAFYMANLHEMTSTHRKIFADGCRHLIGAVQERSRFSLLVRGLERVEYTAYDLRDDYIHFSMNEDGTGLLDVLIPSCNMHLHRRGLPFPGGNMGMAMRWNVLHYEGLRDRIADYVLLKLDAKEPEPKTIPADVLSKIMRVVTGLDEERDYEAWHAWRIEQSGAADVHAWRAELLGSKDPGLVEATLLDMSGFEASRSTHMPLLQRIMADSSMPSDVRARALGLYKLFAKKEDLAQFVALLGDDTVIAPKALSFLNDGSYPFRDHVAIMGLLHARKGKPGAKPKSAKTIATVALQALREITHRDFGTDAQAWQQWIEKAGRLPRSGRTSTWDTSSAHIGL